MNILVIGCGSIGGEVIEECDNLDRVERCYVYDHHMEKARECAKDLRKVSVIEDFYDVLEEVQLVVEAASQEAVKEYLPETLKKGIDVMIMSIGALADDRLREELFSYARKNNTNIYLPTGALCGIGGVESASVVGVDEVTLETKKSPDSLRGSKFVKENDIDLDSMEEETVIYQGPASEAVKNFPKNVNVAAALSIAGIGFERTKVKIICDPHTDKNSHTIKLKGAAGELLGVSRNVPFPENPRTSYLAALSAISALRKICGNVWSGV